MITVGSSVRLRGGKRLAKVIWMKRKEPGNVATAKNQTFNPRLDVTLSKPLNGFRSWSIDDLELYGS